MLINQEMLVNQASSLTVMSPNLPESWRRPPSDYEGGLADWNFYVAILQTNFAMLIMGILERRVLPRAEQILNKFIGTT